MKIKTTSVLKETKYLNLNLTDYEHNEKSGAWVWVERPGNRKAVGIVAVIRDVFNKSSIHLRPINLLPNDKLIVIKEYRIALKGYEWGVPAGLIDSDENIIDAANRELIEETGCEITKVLNTTPFIFNSPGMTNESIAYVFCEAKQVCEQKLESSEEIEVHFMNRREVRQILENAKQNKIMLGAKAWFIFTEFTKTTNF